MNKSDLILHHPFLSVEFLWLYQNNLIFLKEFHNLLAFYQVHNYYRFAEDKLYDRLMDYAEQDLGLSAFRRYEKPLVKYSPERVLKVYEAHLRKAVGYAWGRSYHADWANTLRHMMKLKGGKEVAEKIAADWRE